MHSDGIKSRKLWLTLIALGLIVYGFRLCGSPREMFGQYCMAILAACGLYKAANVIEKSNFARNLKSDTANNN